MGLETGNYIADLNPNNPTATDPVSQGDDHMRLIKKAVQQSFPNISGPVNATQDDLNKVAGGETVNVTGMITMFAGDTPPNGWLACDGAEIDTQYTDLIALVGANTPDMRGLFVRGWSADADVDPEGPRAPLSTQEDAFRSHTHTQSRTSGTFQASIDDIVKIGNNYQTIDTGATGGDETRPKNVAVLYIIKT